MDEAVAEAVTLVNLQKKEKKILGQGRECMLELFPFVQFSRTLFTFPNQHTNRQNFVASNSVYRDSR